MEYYYLEKEGSPAICDNMSELKSEKSEISQSQKDKYYLMSFIGGI